jgi:hypothetical protein
MNIRRPRPTAVLVLAILYFVFGFGFLAGGCFGKGSVYFYVFLEHNAPAEVLAGDPMMAAQIELIRNDPTYVPVATVFLVLYLVVGALQLVAGYGLLSMKWWSRRLALAVAWLVLGVTVVNLLYEFVVLVPRELRGAGGAMGPMPFDPQAFVLAMALVRVIGVLPEAGVCIAALWFLTRPHVRDAFLAVPAKPEEDLPPRPGPADAAIPPGPPDERVMRMD